MKILVLFAHGKESGPWGSKIQYLASIAERFGAHVLSPDYSDLADPDARVTRLLTLPLPEHDRLVLVGSSMGGYISTVTSQTMKPDALFLMAPAFYMPGYADQDPAPGTDNICIVFGWHDDVIPVEHGFRFARTYAADLHILASDHRLKNVLPAVGALFTRLLEKIRSDGDAVPS